MKLKNSILKKHPKLESHNWSKIPHSTYKCVDCGYKIIESNGKLLQSDIKMDSETEKSNYYTYSVIQQPSYSYTTEPIYVVQPINEKTLLSCDENNVKDIVE